jgi:hypothetical protein
MNHNDDSIQWHHAMWTASRDSRRYKDRYYGSTVRYINDCILWRKAVKGFPWWGTLRTAFHRDLIICFPPVCTRCTSAKNIYHRCVYSIYVTQVAGCTFTVAAKFHMSIEAIRADLRPIPAPEDNWPASGRRPEDKKREGGGGCSSFSPSVR